MNNKDRDRLILEKIVSYCAEISKTQVFFGESFAIFSENSIYRNAIALCILQIGELVSCLSDDIKDKFPDVPWRNIKGMRNVVAHKYGDVSVTIVWEAVTGDIPMLRKYCEFIIMQSEESLQ